MNSETHFVLLNFNDQSNINSDCNFVLLNSIFLPQRISKFKRNGLHDMIERQGAQ